MPSRPPLNHDAYNKSRIVLLSGTHDVINWLRNAPHLRDDIVRTLNDISERLLGAIAYAEKEQDIWLERCARNLYIMIPVSLRILRNSPRGTCEKDISEDLISCLPLNLRDPTQWEPQYEEPSDGKSKRPESQRDAPRGTHHHGHCHGSGSGIPHHGGPGHRRR